MNNNKKNHTYDRIEDDKKRVEKYIKLHPERPVKKIIDHLFSGCYKSINAEGVYPEHLREYLTK